MRSLRRNKQQWELCNNMTCCSLEPLELHFRNDPPKTRQPNWHCLQNSDRRSVHSHFRSWANSLSNSSRMRLSKQKRLHMRFIFCNMRNALFYTWHDIQFEKKIFIWLSVTRWFAFAIHLKLSIRREVLLSHLLRHSNSSSHWPLWRDMKLFASTCTCIGKCLQTSNSAFVCSSQLEHHSLHFPRQVVDTCQKRQKLHRFLLSSHLPANSAKHKEM